MQGKLTKRDTRLVADEVVVTDYTIVEPVLIASRLPVQQTSRPGAASAPMTLSLWGGKILIDGVPVEAESGYATKAGSTYILFLRPTRRSSLPSNYELYADGIFEIERDRVIPLLRDADYVFSGTIDRYVSDFTRRISDARRTPQE